MKILADLVLSVHLGFVVFVALGGLFALRWRRVSLAHVPAALWGVGIELFGGVCPLTPLENRLRAAAGEAGYQSGFIEHYLLPVVYPVGLTRPVQIALGIGVLLLNGVIYWRVWRTRASAAVP